MEKYEFHPLSSYFPLMEGEEFKELVEDLKENGLRNRIILYDGKILDGRNRYNACLEAEIKVLFTDYEGDDPLKYVISQNLKRRHLTASQRASIGTAILEKEKEEARERQISTLKQGDKSPVSRTIGTRGGGRAVDKVGKMFGVSGDLVADAQKIKKESPKEFEQILKGEKTVSEVKKERKAKKEHVPKEKTDKEKEDSENLFNLKYWWKRTSQRDRKLFLSWTKERR